MSDPTLGTRRIGILSQWYAPEPVLIPKTISDSLLGDGHSVHVLTNFPNYPDGVTYSGFDASAPTIEDLDGAEVLRVPCFTSQDQDARRRIRSFFSFSWKSVRHRNFLRQCDVVYVYGTPMSAAAAALVLRLLRGVPYVIHIQDLWPESVLDSGMIRNRVVRWVFRGALTLALYPLYAMAHTLIVISPGMRDALIERGVPKSKIVVRLNWHASKVSPKKGALRSGTDGVLHCVYAGNIGQMQDVNSIIRAALQVQNELALQITIYGSGVAEAEAKALADKLEVRNVRFMGRVALEKMASIFSQSDFQLVTLKDRRVFDMTIPSKFQASMAYGVPVITTVQGDLAKICVEEGVGLVARPEDPNSLADALRQAVSLGAYTRQVMSNNARTFYAKSLSATPGITEIKNVLIRAAESGVKRVSIEE